MPLLEDRGALLRRVFRTGLLAAVFPSVCCVVPAIVTAAGLGALSGLVQLSALQPYAVFLSLALIGFLSWRAIQRQSACCSGGRRLALYLSPLFALVVFGAVYVSVIYLLVPALYGPMPDMSMADAITGADGGDAVQAISRESVGGARWRRFSRPY